MRFTITREQLLAQLPKKAGYSLMSDLDDMPSVFVFDGMPVVDKDEAKARYPEFSRVCTPTEWHMFRELIKNPSGISDKIATMYYRPFDSGTLFAPSNVAAVHAKNLRKKLSQHGMPFHLVRIRENPIRKGYYKLMPGNSGVPVKRGGLTQEEYSSR